MYTFTHRQAGTDKVVEFTIPNDDVTWGELIGDFQYFLSGCSFVFDSNFNMREILEEEHEKMLEEKYGNHSRGFENV